MDSGLFQIYLCRIARFYDRLETMLFAETRQFETEVLVSELALSATESPKGIYRPLCEMQQWGKMWQSGYFRLKGEIPPEWKGREIWFHLEMGGEILLYDANYKPLDALTDCSIQVLNFKKSYYPAFLAATPGKLNYYTEVSVNGYNTTVDRDMGVCRHLKYGIFRREVWNLMNDFRTIQSLLEIHQKPPYVIPGGYHWDSHAVKGPVNRRAARLCMVLNQAIDVFAEKPENAVLAREVLRPELERSAQSDELSTTAVGHAHLDIGYLWHLAETRRKACRTFVGQLANIKRYPNYVFGASQAQLYEFVRERMPEVYEEVKGAVESGNWELQGGMWVEADCNLPSGESLLRQFLHGKNFWRDEFGIEVRNHWLPDSFGYPAALPQIMKLADCRYFMAQKLSWNEFNRFPHHTFRWLGHDGSEVLCHFLAEDNYNAYLDPAALHFAEDNYQENHLCDEFLTIFGAGDGGGGPKMEHIELGIRDANLQDTPRLSFGRACDFFDRIELKADEYPQWEGELYFELHRGTLINQGRIKRWNRYLEQKLAAVETLLASADIEVWPARELDNIWKRFLQYQFHDIVTGASLREVHEEVLEDYVQIDKQLTRLIEDVVVVGRKTERETLTFLQTQNHAYSRLLQLPESWINHQVLDEIGAPVALQRDSAGLAAAVPLGALSRRTLTRGDAFPTPAAVMGTELKLENDLILCEFKDDGTLTRFYDKSRKREMIAPKGGNRLLLYVDMPRIFEGWEVEITDRDVTPEPARAERAPEVEIGELRSLIRFHLMIGKSKIEQTVILERGTTRLDFETRVDWREHQRRLRTEFALTTRGRSAYCGIQHGYLRRTVHTNTSWDLARFEFCAHQYVDLSDDAGGVALLDNGRYGHSVSPGSLELSLLRSSRDPDVNADNGEHVFTYAIYSHGDEFCHSNAIVEAAALNRPPLMVLNTTALPEFPFEFEGDGVFIEAFKRAEKSSDRILRLGEVKGRHAVARLRAKASKIFFCDALEWQTGDMASTTTDGWVKIEFHPFEVKTIRLREASNDF